MNSVPVYRDQDERFLCKKNRVDMSVINKIIIVVALIISAPVWTDSLSNNTLTISQGSLENSLFQLMARRVLTEAYARIDKKLRFETFPLQRSLNIANSGVTDGELERIGDLEEKYSSLIQIPVSIAYDDILVYSKNITFNVDGWQSLKPYKVDLLYGFKLGEQQTKGMNIEKIQKVEQGLRKLNAGRSDLFLGSVGFLCTIKKLNLNEIKPLSPAVETVMMFHYPHKQHESLAEKLEVVLIDMQKTGEIKTIQEKAKQDFTMCH